MPQYIRDREGGLHEFAETDSDDHIRQYMQDYWKARSLPPAQMNVAPPPGTQPGNFQPNPRAPSAPFVPLSDDAERAKQMMFIGGLRDQKGMAQAGESLLKTDPTYLHQTGAANELAKLSVDWARRQDAGRQILPALDKMRHMIDDMSTKYPKEYAAATGPYNATPRPAFGPVVSWEAFNAPQQPPVQTRASYGSSFLGMGNDPNSAFNQRAFEIYNELDHLVGATTENVMGAIGGGGGANSDAKMNLFKDLLHRAMTAPNPKAAQKILDSAESALRDVFRLPPRVRNQAELDALPIPPEANHVDYEHDGLIYRKSRVPAPQGRP